MGRSTLKEHGVLKLVHPGGLIEIHTVPITADEVMKMNPKHCVARPDVFKNPWLVVRPESVLKPGSVFYIVPHHTMRKLMLKAQENENEQDKMMIKNSKESVSVEIIDKRNRGKSILKNESSRGTRSGSKNSRVSCDDQSAIECSSVDLSYFNSAKDMAPSHGADKKENTFSCGSKSPVLSCSDLRNSCKESGVWKERNQQGSKSNNRIMPRNDAEFQRKSYPVEFEISSKEISSSKYQPELAERLPETFNILKKPVKDQTEVQQQSNKVDTFHISEKSQNATGLKSCLKTQMPTNTMDLRVRFMLPGDEEKIMRTRLWLLEISLENP